MNERIKELEKQAFDEIWDSDDSLIGPLTHLRPDGFEKKFAELIIKECIQICNQGTATQASSGGSAIMIRQHFGVKE